MSDLEFQLEDSESFNERLLREHKELKKEMEQVRQMAATAQIALSVIKNAILKADPIEGAWECDCPFCHAHADAGAIPHKEGCAIKIAKML